MLTTRFAPSPTGYLHLGHAFSALTAFWFAQREGGRFLLRIEDIDRGRCRDHFVADLLADLQWLGLEWEEPVRRQSEHMSFYGEALSELEAMGLLYPCFCTRKEIAREVAASGAAPHGPDGPLYPGLCRGMSEDEKAQQRASGRPFALRLDMAKALERVGTLYWQDLGRGCQLAKPGLFGDVVLARKEFPTSYHLAVTLDDHGQGVSHVVRGEDLFEATHVHRLLQALLGLDVPLYRHHGLLLDEDGKRLAKRVGSRSLKEMREAGVSQMEVYEMAGFS
uniref:Glutamyl-Q tRNA(Asp) synthetase n=1 Tax=Magnetococcus massalia (strain MO-1) TaxID=451514 RepID=A0A1S7LL65_MAGMO|nr:Glutamyl-Q tRNA(Asp) synthetase [Candidatus Magnetococcus massalia]